MQVIVPHLTENYAAQEDPDEGHEIPVCTLKMFPEDTVHCVEWALSEFKDLFEDQPRVLENEIQQFSRGWGVGGKAVTEPKNTRAAMVLLDKAPTCW